MRYRVWDEEDQKERTLDECITPMEVGTTRRVQIKKGKPKRVDAGVHSVIISHIEEHSKKPAETRNRIIRLLGGGNTKNRTVCKAICRGLGLLGQ